MKLLNSFQDIINKYTLFVCDQWGVLHDGLTLYPNVLQNLHALQTLNKSLVILSNSSRRAVYSTNLMNKLGISSNLFIDLITSGEMLYRQLHKKYAPFDKLGVKVLLWKWTQNDITIVDDLPEYIQVHSIEEADFVIAIGIEDQTLESYKTKMQYMWQHNIPLIVANPDYTSVQENRFVHCPGVLMDKYKQMGGQVYVYGKPYSLIYDFTLSEYKIPKSKILCIGDSLDHDIQGAINYGADSLFITQGILKKQISISADKKEIDNVLSPYKIFPTYSLSFF